MTVRRMKHNPAFLTREELVSSFVVRHADLELVLERLREGGEGPNQHMLLIGPRGIGKTTIVLRIAAAVDAEPELAKRWYPLVFSEESYEVGTAAEFWLEAILHLSDQTGDARLKAVYDELKKQRDEKRLHDQALARLMDFADAQGKRLLVIVENMNMILGEQLSSDEGWTLRHTLQNEHRIMLLGTATTRFDEIDNIQKAMYDLFWTLDLRPLTTEECCALWASVTGREIDTTRVRPIQILTGGNPRLLSVLASFAADMSFRELMSKLTQLVDDHTTYFKSNLESLPVLERKVYVALADIWSPATARDVAEASRIDVNKASALLHRLVQRGIAAEVKQRGRKTSYQVAERMYNIYHLMRRRGGEDSRVRAVVEFMIHMYDRDGLIDVTRSITEEACKIDPEARKDHFAAFLSILDNTASPDVRADIWTSIDPRFLGLEDAPPPLKEMVRKKGGPLLVREPLVAYGEGKRRARGAKDSVDTAGWISAFLQKRASGEDLEEAARQAISRAPDTHDAWILLGYALFAQRRFGEAVEAYRKAVELNGGAPLGQALLGGALHMAGRDGEAVEAYENYLRHRPTEAYAALRLGEIRIHRREYEQAEKAFRLATGIDPSLVEAWYGRGRAIGALGRHAEAEKVLRQAIALGLGSEAMWLRLGAELLAQSRLEEAEAAVREALALCMGTENEPFARYALALSLCVLGKWTDALEEASKWLLDERLVREQNARVVDFFVGASAAGHSKQVLSVLEVAPTKSHLEPLIVALQMIAGKDHNAPQEVVEVASDIVRQIEALRRAEARDRDAAPKEQRSVAPAKGKRRATPGKTRK